MKIEFTILSISIICFLFLNLNLGVDVFELHLMGQASVEVPERYFDLLERFLDSFGVLRECLHGIGSTSRVFSSCAASISSAASILNLTGATFSEACCASSMATLSGLVLGEGRGTCVPCGPLRRRRSSRAVRVGTSGLGRAC